MQEAVDPKEGRRGRKAQPFIRGAQRRLEARIGQLLGPPIEGRPENNCSHESSLVERNARARFRLLAQALGGEVTLS